QNAVDAIRSRQHREPEFPGQVTFEVIEVEGNRPTTLIVTDNGSGLTEAEVHRFLATIGESSKREQLRRDDFIGQFGIGLLSGFVVSEEIVVISRSIDEGSRSVEWRGRADGTYSLRTLERDIAPGTQVYLRAKPGCAEFFEPRFVCDTARSFGRLLPIPIQVVAGGTRTLINDEPPWRHEYTSLELRRLAYLEYGKRMFETDFFDAIPLRSEEGGIDGIAYVLSHSANIAGKRTHRVYLKNMLLSEQSDNLLPDWAFFVKCVLNVSQLRPTAARDAFYEDDQLEAARGAIGACLKNYLMEMSRCDRHRLNRLIELHGLAIRSLALEDDEIYRLFIRWLPFETSMGQMTLDEHGSDSPVQYVSTCDQFRQISGVAAALEQVIFNAGYAFDQQLLDRLPRIFPDQTVEQVDVATWSQSLDDLTLDERDEAFDLVKLADLALHPFGCGAEIKKFEPKQLPALYTVNDSALFMRSAEQSQELADDLWSGVLDDLMAQRASTAAAQLCLNYLCPLVRKLVKVRDRELASRAIEVLYVQALLMGHYPVRPKELAALNQGLWSLIEFGIGSPAGPDNG
ncbi:MAG: HSP90 family protein, partial [Pirellulales bacterium]